MRKRQNINFFKFTLNESFCFLCSRQEIIQHENIVSSKGDTRCKKRALFFPNHAQANFWRCNELLTAGLKADFSRLARLSKYEKFMDDFRGQLYSIAGIAIDGTATPRRKLRSVSHSDLWRREPHTKTELSAGRLALEELSRENRARLMNELQVPHSTSFEITERSFALHSLKGLRHSICMGYRLHIHSHQTEFV